MKRQYFWLNANPNYWTFHTTPVGISQDYTIYNEYGNKRYIFKCFLDAKIGDIVIGYQGSPTRQILAIYKITKEVKDPSSKEETIDFTKVLDIQNAITRKDLENYGLQDIRPMRQGQGSIFPLDEKDFLAIVDLIEEKNPDILEGYYTSASSLSEKIELLDITSAIEYAKECGSYYLGWGIPVGIDFSESEIKNGLMIKKVEDGFQESERDKSLFLITTKESRDKWIDEKNFSFKFESEADNLLDVEPVPDDYNLEQYIHILYETDDNKYRYLGIAELNVQEDLIQSPKGPEDKYIYLVTVKGNII